ncbi:sugar ABC transporter permease, partial [Paenibacillus kobensis]|uniref:sugar ABC transporter permease n=1 Tax=Paenibacillus kobensis TaxID=59841 RepID=UPI000FDC302B
MSVKHETMIEQASLKQRPNWFKFDARAYTMIGALMSIWILFSLLHDRFLSATNLSNLFLQMSVTSILAIGMVLVIVAGQIDLSIGSLVGFMGGIAAMLNVWYEWSTIPVIIATLGAGAAIGFIQGWIIAYRAVPAFIVTLGGMLIFRGALFGTTGSVTIAPLSPSLKSIGQSYIADGIGWVLGIIGLAIAAVLVLRKRSARAKFGFEVEPMPVSLLRLCVTGALIIGFVYLMNSYKGIPVPFVMVIVLALIFTFISRNTTFGRHIYAIGGNPEAA